MEPDLNVHFIEKVEEDLKRNHFCVMAFSENLEKSFRDLKRLCNSELLLSLAIFFSSSSARKTHRPHLCLHISICSIRAGDRALSRTSRSARARARPFANLLLPLSILVRVQTELFARRESLHVDAPSRKRGRVDTSVEEFFTRQQYMMLIKY